MFDWQGFGRGHWALDYTYALMSALSVEDRRNWERDLLKRYVERVAEAGVRGLSFDTAWLAWRLHPLHGLVYWLYTVGAGRLQPDMQPEEFSRAIIGRIAQAVDDLDTLDALSFS